MVQFKIFTNRNSEDLEQKVNAWLGAWEDGGMEIVDRKLERFVIGVKGTAFFTMVISYRSKRSEGR